MNRLIACTLALLVVLLTPASANSAPTRLGGTGGSALTVDEGCPVTVTAEQLTFDVSGAGDSNGLTAHVKAVYQMENPTENPLSLRGETFLKLKCSSQYAEVLAASIFFTASSVSASITREKSDCSL